MYTRLFNYGSIQCINVIINEICVQETQYTN